MKKFALLKCFGGGNTAVAECSGVGLTKEEAITHFNAVGPVNLDADGYTKIGDVTYTVSEEYTPFYEAGA